jgi:hypothetical protein
MVAVVRPEAGGKAVAAIILREVKGEANARPSGS